jgi:hypothetical protein
MRSSLAQRLKKRLVLCVSGWATLGRLHCLELLAAPSILDMEVSASTFARRLDQALRLERFLGDYYFGKPTAVTWPTKYNPVETGVLHDGIIDRDELAESIGQLELELSNTVSDLLSDLKDQILTRPASCLVSELASDLPFPSARCPKRLLQPTLEPIGKENVPLKVLSGPLSVPSDPIFHKSYSLLEFDAPTFGDSPEQTAPYFWTLANREALASQLCSLSAIEYDRLPLEFYWDMAKQSWDEARHANYFLRTSISLANELRERSGFDSTIPWLELDQFWSTGRGLPIPREGNLYESMLNADLVERLILMNYRTETPAIARKSERINSRFCQVRPEVADAYEIDKFDETSHAIIGKRWLDRLLPAAEQRATRIDETDLLRNVLLLTSFCHHGSMSMTELLGRYTSRKATRGRKAGNATTMNHCSISESAQRIPH